MLVGLQAKLAALGAALLIILAAIARFKVVKHQRDRAVQVAETLKARHVFRKKTDKIKREEKVKLVSRRAEIIKEISKDEKDFKGVDNLSNPNDF